MNTTKSHAQKNSAPASPIIVERANMPAMQSLNNGLIQRKANCACGGGCSKCMAKKDKTKPLQSKSIIQNVDPHPHTMDLQRKAANEKPSNSSFQLGNSTGNAMPADIQERAQSVFGTDLSTVRFHNDANAHSSAEQIQARAFTTGHDVYFGAGWYQPQTKPGLQLIGHELTHVVQQRKGLSASRLRGVGDEYEQEADSGGDAFANGLSAQVTTAGGESQGVQRTANPGAEAERGAGDDSPNGLPFLGMANTYEELVALMGELSALEGAPLGIVPEDFAMAADDSAPAAVASAPASEEAPVQASLLDKPIQRAVVAGCNAPGVPANLIGVAAHMQIGGNCVATAPGCMGGGHPGFQIPGAGRPDMVRSRPPFIDEVGEIKPASWIARGLVPVAAAELAVDLASYNTIIGPAMPMWSYSFPGAPFILNPTQQLRAWGPSGGLYFYSCTGGTRRRVRVRVRVPNPIPVPVPRTVPFPRTVPSGPSAEDVGKGVVVVGAGIGIGYLIYRGVRMVPSLFPPLWPTIPANLAIP